MIFGPLSRAQGRRGSGRSGNHRFRVSCQVACGRPVDSRKVSLGITGITAERRLTQRGIEGGGGGRRDAGRRPTASTTWTSYATAASGKSSAGSGPLNVGHLPARVHLRPHPPAGLRRTGPPGSQLGLLGGIGDVLDLGLADVAQGGLDQRPMPQTRRSSRSVSRLVRDAAYAFGPEVLAGQRRVIASGEVAPGMPIPLTEMAALLQVSLIPIREALETLPGEGLVDDRPRLGYRVTTLRRAELRQPRHTTIGDSTAASCGQGRRRCKHAPTCHHERAGTDHACGGHQRGHLARNATRPLPEPRRDVPAERSGSDI